MCRCSGTVQLPATIRGFRRTPGDLRLVVDAPDLKQLTALMTKPVTGSLQAQGTIKTDQSIARLEMTAQGDLIGFGDAAAKSLAAKISATKKLPATDATEEPFYANLTSSIHAELNDVHDGEYVVDQVSAEIKSAMRRSSIEPLSVQRNANLLLVRGHYQLPPRGWQSRSSNRRDLQFSFRAPQLSDYWQSEASNKVTGEMQADGNVRIRHGVMSGLVNLSGEQIVAQKLLVKQVSGQIAIAENVAYLNDFTATMNDKDYVVAQGTVQIKKPFRYTGSATANLADLSAFEPAVCERHRIGKKTPLAGSLVLNWNGQGDIAMFQNNGDLKLKLEHGRYADLQNLHADVEAHYTPSELKVPIIFVGSDKLDLEANLEAKGETLEISKIAINQGTAQYATAYAAVPFVWRNLGTERPLFLPNGKVLISFRIRKPRYRPALRKCWRQAAGGWAAQHPARRSGTARPPRVPARFRNAKPARQCFRQPRAGDLQPCRATAKQRAAARWKNSASPDSAGAIRSAPAL